MEKDSVCMEHSGCDARISQLERNDTDIFKRLLQVEFAVVKTSVITGIVSAVGSAALVLILGRMFH